MSHFSKIKTSIYNLKTLKKTLEDLGFLCDFNQNCIRNSNFCESVNFVAINSHQTLGFYWNGLEYDLVADAELWPANTSINSFLEKLKQHYAINTIVDKSTNDGFSLVRAQSDIDGSVKLLIQKWN
uniref:Uncharacterized protein ycf35 n=1 Tax=Spyridia filamentosa TaxID=196632 RepID=A0A1Z1MK45_SPYFI|nr:hypothetical protein [Spyridia filamentosa]ARW66124.1 hypothetical protein [Spyridia filamentosa]